MANTIEITRVKLVDDGKTVEIDITESGKIQLSDKKQGKEAVHPDFIKAMAKLTFHFAVISGHIRIEQTDKKDLEPYKATGYKLGGKENEGFTISGYVTTTYPPGYGHATPFMRFGKDNESVYPLIADVKNIFEEIEKEARAYLFSGKKAQQDFDFPEGEKKEGKVTKMQVASPEAIAKDIVDSVNEGIGKVAKNGQQPNMGDADPDAMKIVAEMDNENGEAKLSIEEGAEKTREKRTKRVPQSPQHKNGLAHEDVE